MSSASTAAALQHLLESEGAVIHAALQARALPSMGGGVGMVLTKPLSPGSTLARFPFRSMITARKARFNLAMAEVALELHRDKTQPPNPTSAEEKDLFPMIPFTSRVWSEDEFESQVRSQQVRSAIDAKVEELEEALDSTEAIVCYILLMAALHGRWQARKEVHSPGQGKANEDEEASLSASRCVPKLLRFTHENRWMRTWIHALPVQYDNLLELAPEQTEATAALDAGAAARAAGHGPQYSGAPSSPVAPLPLRASYTTSSDWFRSYVSLSRFRAAALGGQRSIEQRYRKCCAVLQSLRSMPMGEEVDNPCVSGQAATADNEEKGREQHQQHAPGKPHVSSIRLPALSQTSQTSLPDQPESGRGSPVYECTLGHFLWAFNTLMSRGFYFPEETWALMPFVDYFNYALDSNGTMYPQEDDPEDAECLSNVSLLKANLALSLAAAPRKQARRTGLRSARVGRGAIPQANYNTYEFQLVRPVRDAGEQVMLHYGAYSDIELLMWYGFTLRPSLLSVSHIFTTDAGASGNTCSFVPLLPPGLADADKDNVFLNTARALRVLLPQIVCEAERVAYYRQHVLRSRLAAASGAFDEEDRREASVDGNCEEGEEGDYNTWAKALQRAYRLPLSPLADAEGNYPPMVRGQTWIDVLFTSFMQTPPLVMPAAGATSADHAAALKMDAWMRQWVAQRWPMFAEAALPRVSKGCGLGVFGLSPALHAAVTSSFWASPRVEMLPPAEQILLVRGIAWAELYVNLRSDARSDDDASTKTGAPVSAAAAAMAQIASVDQWALLRFLALEGSDAALREYLAYESEAD